MRRAAERRAKRGKKTSLLDERVEIPDHLEAVWYAFRTLSASRSGTGYGPNPIPISEILSTMGYFGLIDEEDSVTIIQGLDLVYLNDFAEKAEKARKK